VVSQTYWHKGEIIDYGVNMCGAPLEWPETMGEGIRVGIIDTGIDYNHVDLKNRIKAMINFTSKDRKDVYDQNGHGTHVAGIIAAEKNGVGVVGVAPKADLYIARAFDKNGNGEFEAIKNSLEWMIEQNVHIINMSFSSNKGSDKYHNIISKCYKAGITMVCAAGNDGESAGDTIGFPARYPECIAVVAVDINKKSAPFSSRGPKAEIAAAGKDIYSCFSRNSYARLSGTSMATPIISGCAALLQAKGIRRFKRRLTPDEIRLLLNVYTEDISEYGHDSTYGYGVFSFGRINTPETVLAKTSVINSRYARSPRVASFISAMLRKPFLV